jgi:hypothetical protein
MNRVRRSATGFACNVRSAPRVAPACVSFALKKRMINGAILWLAPAERPPTSPVSSPSPLRYAVKSEGSIPTGKALRVAKAVAENAGMIRYVLSLIS